MSPAATIQLDAFIAELENLAQAATTVFAQVADSEQLESARLSLSARRTESSKPFKRNWDQLMGRTKKQPA